jgi:hypothetical protein
MGLVADMFPALVSVYRPEDVLGMESPFEDVGLSDSGAEKFTECRVIVQKNLLIVGAHTARGVQAVFRGEVEEIFKSGQFTRVLTRSGHLVVFAKSKGCGCGSKLRAWNPYGKMVRSNKDG